jgi:predicted DNA-binding transcriptional regulator AlpA
MPEENISTLKLEECTRFLGKSRHEIYSSFISGKWVTPEDL